MTTAINMFLKTTIRENDIPFSLKIDIPNETTKVAIEEGRKLAKDDTVKEYKTIDELKETLGLE